LPTLVALVIAIFGGGLVLAAAVSRRSPPLPPDPFPLPVSAPAPPPVQFQERPVTGVRLPSAFADYTFAFAAKVVWRPATNSVAGAGEIAVQEIIHRACGITERRDPSQVTLIASELAMALRELQSDPNEQVHFRAEGVQLQLSLEDQQRLDEATTLRKQEGLWEYHNMAVCLGRSPQAERRPRVRRVPRRHRGSDPCHHVVQRARCTLDEMTRTRRRPAVPHVGASRKRG